MKTQSPMLVTLEKFTRAVFAVSLLACVYLYLVKDNLPGPAYYDLGQLREPQQSQTRADNFTTHSNDQQYLIKPLYDYELEGVVVSLHDADSFLDVTHHRRWQDYINLRDLCVIWGDNVSSGVYLDMGFKNGTWTCWFSWPNQEVGSRFNGEQLSNNHLIIDDDLVKQALMQAEPGDHVRLRGMLVEYENPGNGFKRGSSVTRSDTGNGACETIYVEAFEMIRKANPGVRQLYTITFWLCLFSLAGVVWLFIVTPFRVASD